MLLVHRHPRHERVTVVGTRTRIEFLGHFYGPLQCIAGIRETVFSGIDLRIPSDRVDDTVLFRDTIKLLLIGIFFRLPFTEKWMNVVGLEWVFLAF